MGVAIDYHFMSPLLAYRCLDWSERRDHTAGKLPKALLTHCLQHVWLVAIRAHVRWR